jgi:hypothetical protein
MLYSISLSLVPSNILEILHKKISQRRSFLRTGEVIVLDTTYDLGCHWGPRLEDAPTCAERLAFMLKGLATLHWAFAHWQKQGDSSSAANRPFCTMPPRIAELTKIFQQNPITEDFPEDGFCTSAWNGQDSSRGVGLTLFVGSNEIFPTFSNDVSLTFYPQEAANTDLVNAAVLRAVLLVSVAAWNPNWAGISPFDYFTRWERAEPWDDLQRKFKQRDEQSQRKRASDAGYVPPIQSGWMTYLCADYARRITRPPGIEVEPVAGGGALLIATREIFMPGNPAHDAAADAIQNALMPLQNLPRDA